MIPSSQTALIIASKVTGSQVSHAEFIYDGATSRAWKVTCGATEMIVRIVRPDAGRPTTYLSEFGIYKKLKQHSIPVPQAIATYKDFHIEEVTLPWAVSLPVSGVPIRSDSMSKTVARDLGRMLQIIHSLRVENYGRLEEREDIIIGKQKTPFLGLLARWCWGFLWPYQDKSLELNAAYNLFGHLSDRIHQYEDVIQYISEDEKVVLVHSDLHNEHIFVKDSQISGIIDFGAAFIGVAEWEFARLGCQFGWSNVKTALETYTSMNDHNFRFRIYLLGLVICLYKLHRYICENSSEKKINKAIGILVNTLDELDNIG